MSATLKQPGDNATCYFYVLNKGTINAKSAGATFTVIEGDKTEKVLYDLTGSSVVDNTSTVNEGQSILFTAGEANLYTPNDESTKLTTLLKDATLKINTYRVIAVSAEYDPDATEAPTGTAATRTLKVSLNYVQG